MRPFSILRARQGLFSGFDFWFIDGDGDGPGLAFIAAWKQARLIVDSGHGPGDEPAPGGRTPPPNP